MKAVIPLEVIEQRILLIRGQKVMLSTHLAELYDVETRVLNQAVKRNISRFPEDFMFQLNISEAEQLVSQNVIPHKKYFGGALPYAFTEQGVAMLSSVLNSERAIQVNIEMMRHCSLFPDYTCFPHAGLARKTGSFGKEIRCSVQSGF